MNLLEFIFQKIEIDTEMPIKIPDSLPAKRILKDEGVMVMSDHDANRQDIRPLKIALLNLMPQKIQTETQFARLIGATPLQIEFYLIYVSSYKGKNTSEEHMSSFYRTFDELRNEKFDGLIITGAPIEHLDFNEVKYWDELVEIFEWTKTNVFSSLGVCWGAMAMLKYFHGIEKYKLSEKAFGCFRHMNLNPSSPYLRGFSDDFIVPVSRWTEIKTKDILNEAELELLITSDQVGPCLVSEKNTNNLYIFNHLEYDSKTLKNEYLRDILENANVQKPVNYFPDDDPEKSPENRWRSHAHLLYGNWINEIYQETPYDISNIGILT